MTAADEEELDMGEDIFYVAETELASIKKKIADSKEVTKDDVDKLTFPENLPDDAMMVPVDMRGIEEDFDDVEAMVEQLGPKGAAEAFLKARDFFEKNKKEGCAEPMTAAEWSKVLEEDAMEGGEEEMMFPEGEEEDFLEEPEEEDGDDGDDDEDAAEPAAKKAKTN